MKMATVNDLSKKFDGINAEYSNERTNLANKFDSLLRDTLIEIVKSEEFKTIVMPEGINDYENRINNTSNNELLVLKSEIMTAFNSQKNDLNNEEIRNESLRKNKYNKENPYPGENI